MDTRGAESCDFCFLVNHVTPRLRTLLRKGASRALRSRDATVLTQSSGCEFCVEENGLPDKPNSLGMSLFHTLMQRQQHTNTIQILIVFLCERRLFHVQVSTCMFETHGPSFCSATCAEYLSVHKLLIWDEINLMCYLAIHKSVTSCYKDSLTPPPPTLCWAGSEQGL